MTNKIPAPREIFSSSINPSGLDLKLRDLECFTPSRLLRGEGNTRQGARLYHDHENGNRLRLEQAQRLDDIARNADALAFALLSYDPARAEEWAEGQREARAAEQREQEEMERAAKQEAMRYRLLDPAIHLIRGELPAMLPGYPADALVVDRETGEIALANTGGGSAARSFLAMVRAGQTSTRPDVDGRFIDMTAARALVANRNGGQPGVDVVDAWFDSAKTVRRHWVRLADLFRRMADK